MGFVSAMRLVLVMLLLLASGTVHADPPDGGTQPSVRDQVRKSLSAELPVPKLPPVLPTVDKDVRAPKIVVPTDCAGQQAREQAAQQLRSSTKEALRSNTLRVAEDAARAVTSGQSTDLRSTATQQARTAAAQSTNGQVPASLPGSETPGGGPSNDVPADLPSRPAGNPGK